MTPSDAFVILGWAIVAALAIVAVTSSIAVWRIGPLAPIHRCGLITAIAIIALAGIGWIVFVAPAYMD